MSTRFPQDVCSKCGWKVSLRPEPRKVETREEREDGGYDHVDGRCPAVPNDREWAEALRVAAALRHRSLRRWAIRQGDVSR